MHRTLTRAHTNDVDLDVLFVSLIDQATSIKIPAGAWAAMGSPEHITVDVAPSTVHLEPLPVDGVLVEAAYPEVLVDPPDVVAQRRVDLVGAVSLSGAVL